MSPAAQQPPLTHELCSPTLHLTLTPTPHSTNTLVAHDTALCMSLTVYKCK